MRELRVFGAQKLAPRRGVVIDLARFHDGARGGGCGLGCAEATVFGFDAPGMRVARRATGQSELRDGRDAGECLAAKAEAQHAFEVVERGDLAGGMAGQSELEVVARDALAIVADLDLLDTARLQIDLHAAGACIQAVFQQLLERCGGAVDDFARGDLIDQQLGQALNRHDGAIIDVVGAGALTSL
jgi:hypothetical protein